MAASPTPAPPTLDLTTRLDPALLPELMDGPCSYETFRATVHDIAATTRITLAYQPTFRFLKHALRHRTSRSPLNIVDVGSGGGDVLRRIARWARSRKLSVQLTGIDLNPHASRAATQFSSQDPTYSRIHWITGDLFTHPSTQTPDLVLSSLVTHHMRDNEIIEFLRWMEAHAALGWFVSDLVRSPRSYRLFRILSRIMRWHPYVQHDGLVSIRRAFREPDWQRFLAAAGIPADAVTPPPLRHRPPLPHSPSLSSGATLLPASGSKPFMMENVIPAGGQGAVEFDDSAEAGSVESRISLVRALVEDIRSTGEAAYSHQIIVDDRVWNVRIEQQ